MRERYSGADILVETFSEPLVEYLRAVHAAGGFAAFAEARQCQLKTIKLLARVPAVLVPTIQDFWLKPRLVHIR